MSTRRTRGPHHHHPRRGGQAYPLGLAMSLAMIMPGCGVEADEPIVRAGASALTLDDDTDAVPTNAKVPSPDTDADLSPTKGKGGKGGKGSGGTKSPKKEAPTKPIVPVQSTCGEDPSFASNDVGQFDVDQWIGLKGALDACADYASAVWEVEPLFPATLVPGASIPAGLANYCVARPVSPGVVPTAADAVSKLVDLARDRLVFPTESALSAGVFPDMRDRFLDGTGYLAAPDDHLPTAPTVPVDLYVLDTQPAVAPATPRSPHGVSLTGMAQELACGSQASCSRQVRPQLAMSRFYAGLSDAEYDPTAPLATYADPVNGGNFGTQAELAVAVVRTMLEHQELRKKTQGSLPRRVVLNMSLGWDPALFGDMPESVYADAGAQLNLLTNFSTSSGVNGPVRAVHAALASATCDGALLLASTGNEVPGICDAGPLLPAGLNTLERLSQIQCEQAQLQGISEVPGYPYAQLTKAPQPLVYGVGATDWDQEEATFQRDDAVPLLNALGFKGAAFTDGSGTRSGILTGTSVSSVVAAASLATAWSHAPTLSSDAIVGAVAFQAPTFNAQGGVVQALADYGVGQVSGTATPARVLSVCGALDAVADVQGVSALGVCPATAGLVNPDVDALIDDAVVTYALSDQTTASAPLKPAKCTNACGEPYLFRETTVADWQTGPLLQGNFVSPQPHSNLCPACNINGGGTGGGGSSAAGGTGSVRLAIDQAYVQLTPGNVTIIRSGAGTSVIVGLGNVFDGLDSSQPLTVLSTSLADDPTLDLDDATVVVEFTDPATGLTFNAYDSITVTE